MSAPTINPWDYGISYKSSQRRVDGALGGTVFYDWSVLNGDKVVESGTSTDWSESRAEMLNAAIVAATAERDSGWW